MLDIELSHLLQEDFLRNTFNTYASLLEFQFFDALYVWYYCLYGGDAFLDVTLPIEIWSCLAVYVLRIFFIYLMRLVHFSEETILHHLRRTCLSRAYR